MFLRKVDMLSPKITLYYKRKNVHVSAISGVLTIIAYGFIFIFACIYFNRYINRENLSAYYYNRYIKDIGTFSFDNFNFFNFVQIKKGNGRKTIDIDFDKIEIIGINITLEAYMRLPPRVSMPHWLYGKCDDEVNIKGIEYLLDKNEYSQSGCIKKFYNNLEDKYYDINDDKFEFPIFKHGASHPNATFYGVALRKCVNTSFRLSKIGPCADEKDIEDYVSTISFLNFTIIDNYIDVLNYKNSVTKYLMTKTCGVSPDSYVVNNLNFNPALIKSYDYLFTQQSKEQTTYIFYENQQTTTLEKNSQYLGAYFIWLQNTQQYYERQYKKIYDALAEIGGFGSIIIMIAKIINYIIARFNMLSDTQQLISNLVKKNDTIYERIVSSKNLRRFIEENERDKEEENKKIKIFNQRLNKITNTENSDEGKSESKKIIINRVNVINNNQGEETNRINKNNENIEQTDNKIGNLNYSRFIQASKSGYTKKYVSYIFSLISKKDHFNCWSYLLYLIFCKQFNSKVRYYEDLRRLIISEECMLENYFNIYKLLEANHIYN